MARSRFNNPIESMDLGNMRQNGVRSLAIQCHKCRHEVIINVGHLPDHMTVTSFSPRMACTKCGPSAPTSGRISARWRDSRSGVIVLLARAGYSAAGHAGRRSQHSSEVKPDPKNSAHGCRYATAGAAKG
jgi:hypothetical protein